MTYQEIDSLIGAATQAVRKDYQGDIDMALVLGSGLGGLAQKMKVITRFAYVNLPGFQASSVSGHASELLIAEYAGKKLAVFCGRIHYYEHGEPRSMRIPIGLAASLGTKILLLTNAAGGIADTLTPASLMLINDHIDFTGQSPLFDCAPEKRFVGLEHAYDLALREHIKRAAQSLAIDLFEGVYMWFCGPHFETPAEIRAAKILGADTVGMSTVPEVIIARAYGMRVAALSVITNRAAGLSDIAITHEQTLAYAQKASHHASQLVLRFIEMVE